MDIEICAYFIILKIVRIFTRLILRVSQIKTHIIVLLYVMNRVLKFHIKQARDTIGLGENGMIYVLFVKINQGKSMFM